MNQTKPNLFVILPGNVRSVDLDYPITVAQSGCCGRRSRFDLMNVLADEALAGGHVEPEAGVVGPRVQVTQARSGSCQTTRYVMSAVALFVRRHRSLKMDHCNSLFVEEISLHKVISLPKLLLTHRLISI